MNSLKIIKEEGVWLEIINLVVPGWTDKPEMITQMCDWLEIRLRGNASVLQQVLPCTS